MIVVLYYFFLIGLFIKTIYKNLNGQKKYYLYFNNVMLYIQAEQNLLKLFDFFFIIKRPFCKLQTFSKELYVDLN